MNIPSQLFVYGLLGVGLVACSAEKKHESGRQYSAAEETAIRKQVGSLKGLDMVCFAKFQDAYRAGFHDACVQIGGEKIGGGCAHVVGQLFLPTQAMEQGLKQCGVRPNNSFKPKPLRGSA